jgi:serine phosphatase RsbU (regulator of sigma subunit)
VQQRLSRTTISVSGFDIAGKTHSALETSGDYFDFIKTSDGHVLLAVGDVSGHGKHEPSYVRLQRENLILRIF